MNPLRWEQICAILTAALQSTPTDREVVLEERCAGDPVLRADVDRYLAYGERACQEHFLMTPDIPALPPDRDDPLIGPLDGFPQDDPTAIGRYRVIELLGEGGCGRVYLARDDDFNRDVAIKVLNPEQIADPADVEAYLAEARILARLDHPNIVRAYDLGRTDDGLCYIVSQYIAGGNLADRIKKDRPSFIDASKLIASISEAAHYAHNHGVVHRDIKPANILLDASSKPFLADFGLALKDEDVGKGAMRAGTPDYMSPEQARSEGHRVDGRSDIFSLGVVFYELLTGRLPFSADSGEEVMDKIVNSDPRPPRGIDDTIPKELERICLKAISKRASERYNIATDMAEDLELFLQNADRTLAPATPTSTIILRSAPTEEAISRPPTPRRPEPDGHPVRIVPKGLRSFDEHDADFFLELLPGPRDRDNLPETIRFWKTRIELIDPNKSFRIGLIFGPSGCGKSSFLKAGLLPRLANHVVTVYIEASAVETEARLLRGIRSAVPGLVTDRNLVDSMAVLRRGRGLNHGQKVLLVLDQFEQWLFARRGEENTELVTALRQCDGEHVQAIVLVRDDFSTAAIRFMQSLEIPLHQGDNSSLVDLFDLLHSEKVLAAFGRAYGRLPEVFDEHIREHESFLKHAVRELAEDGKVIPIRLSLFAEMLKGRPWTPKTLKEVGRMPGLGVKFLKATFNEPTSPPLHLLHQNAAQAVLKSLLPEVGRDIKQCMRSEAQLCKDSGYVDSPRDFEDLIHILNAELRLITPTKPEQSAAGHRRTNPAGERHYQLTHDYLIPSLRDWLDEKQRETAPGRAELLLTERTALWSVKPQRRLLPSAPEWLRIRLLTRARDWTETQRQMMNKAGQLYAVIGLSLIILVGLAACFSVLGYQWTQASKLVHTLAFADTARVPGLLKELEGYRDWTTPMLRGQFKKTGNGSRERLNVGLALLRLRADTDAVYDEIREHLPVASPAELKLLSDNLPAHPPALSRELWPVLESAVPGDPRYLAAAALLANCDGDDPRWDEISSDVARAMVKVDTAQFSSWLEIFHPVKEKLIAALIDVVRDVSLDRLETDRARAANYLSDYLGDRPEDLVNLLKGAGPNEFAILFPAVNRGRDQTLPFLRTEVAPVAPAPDLPEEEKDRRAEQQARAAVAMVRMGVGEEVWPLLAHKRDPRLRSFIVHWLAALGAEPGTIGARLQGGGQVAGKKVEDAAPSDPNLFSLFERDTSIRRALILALGQYKPVRLPASDLKRLTDELLKSYRDDPDPGVHGAAEWTLRCWGEGGQLKSIDLKMSKETDRGDRRWYVNSLGQTLVIVDGPLEFLMGSPEAEPDHQNEESQHSRRIRRRFAIASKEVSVGQFEEFRKEYSSAFPALKEVPAGGPDVPQPVSWFTAAAYCNWLSKQERRTPVYELNAKDEFAEGMRVKAGAFDGGGYYLPREAEWEYACRSGSETSRYYGNSWRLLDKYAILVAWARDRPSPCGSVMPNDLGMFDMMGNLNEWCHDREYDYADIKNGSASDFLLENVTKDDARVMRGASFVARPLVARSAFRYTCPPSAFSESNGFRPARCPDSQGSDR
jgi:eukaryotic-like serine/threonine-protein kinase